MRKLRKILGSTFLPHKVEIFSVRGQLRGTFLPSLPFPFSLLLSSPFLFFRLSLFLVPSHYPSIRIFLCSSPFSLFCSFPPMPGQMQLRGLESAASSLAESEGGAKAATAFLWYFESGNVSGVFYRRRNGEIMAPNNVGPFLNPPV